MDDAFDSEAWILEAKRKFDQFFHEECSEVLPVAQHDSQAYGHQNPQQNPARSSRVSAELLSQIVETIEDFSQTDLNYLLQVAHFSQRFKQQRLQRKLTQKEVGKFSIKREISQTTISRFEDMAMPFTNMVKLRPELQGFMDLTEVQLRAIPRGTASPRRRRSKFNAQQVEHLERLFNEKSHREREELEEIAAFLGLEAYAVRNWFHNRRNRGAPTCVRIIRKRSL